MKKSINKRDDVKQDILLTSIYMYVIMEEFPENTEKKQEQKKQKTKKVWNT